MTDRATDGIDDGIVGYMLLPSLASSFFLLSWSSGRVGRGSPFGPKSSCADARSPPDSDPQRFSLPCSRCLHSTDHCNGTEKYRNIADDPRASAATGEKSEDSVPTGDKRGGFRTGGMALEACNGWYSGAYLRETLPSVLYILMRHGHDPEEAIVRAVNDTRDNDTVAAIVGAAVGALHGGAALPKRWRRGLTGRTAERDDGRIDTLLAEARRAFWGHAEAADERRDLFPKK